MQWSFWAAGYLFMTEVTATSTLFLSFFYWTFLFSPKVICYAREVPDNAYCSQQK